MLEVGQTFGAWEILEQGSSDSKYVCVCRTCGKTKREIKQSDLLSNKSLLCKYCTSKKTTTSVKQGTTKHEYSSWSAMVQRCTNPNSKDYKNYGGKGITIFPLWRDSFEAFYMMVGPKPTPDHTIERIDFRKGYEPGNVTWATREVQVRNKSDNIHIEYDGEKKTVAEWSEDPRCPVTKFTVYKRLKRGWDPHKALFTTSKRKNNE